MGWPCCQGSFPFRCTTMTIIEDKQRDLASKVTEMLLGEKGRQDVLGEQLTMFLEWVRKWESENKGPLLQLEKLEDEHAECNGVYVADCHEINGIHLRLDHYPEDKTEWSSRLAQLGKEVVALETKKDRYDSEIEELKFRLPDSPWDQLLSFPGRPENPESERWSGVRRLAGIKSLEPSESEKQMLDFVSLAIFLNKSTDRRLVKHAIFDCSKNVNSIWKDMQDYWTWCPVLSQALSYVPCYLNESLKTGGNSAGRKRAKLKGMNVAAPEFQTIT